MAAGIGFFLAHIGYQAGEGIGLVVADPATLVTLGQTLANGAQSVFPNSHCQSVATFMRQVECQACCLDRFSPAWLACDSLQQTLDTRMASCCQSRQPW